MLQQRLSSRVILTLASRIYSVAENRSVSVSLAWDIATSGRRIHLQSSTNTLDNQYNPVYLTWNTVTGCKRRVEPNMAMELKTMDKTFHVK